MKDGKLKSAILRIYDAAYLAGLRTKDNYTMLRLGTPKIMSMDETMDYLIENQCSVCRFGDGELKLASGEGISFQRYDPQMEQRLQAILKCHEPGLLVCIPDYFTHATWMKKDAREFMWRRVAQYRRKWTPLLDQDRRYGNASITRCYIDWEDKSRSEAWFCKLKGLWNNRDVVFIEGRYSRLGVGNDLFDNAASIGRILCPEKNAFACYQQILDAASQLEKECLILLALGPTATVLAYDLSKLGYQAVDIGHVDIEYEWFLQKAESKVKIVGKYTNEAKGGTVVEEINDAVFQQQILAKIDNLIH